MEPWEALGIVILAGPLALGLGGLFLTMIKDTFRRSRPLLRISAGRTYGETEREAHGGPDRESEILSYINELKKQQ